MSGLRTTSKYIHFLSPFYALYFSFIIRMRNKFPRQSNEFDVIDLNSGVDGGGRRGSQAKKQKLPEKGKTRKTAARAVASAASVRPEAAQASAAVDLDRTLPLLIENTTAVRLVVFTRDHPDWEGQPDEPEPDISAQRVKVFDHPETGLHIKKLTTRECERKKWPVAVIVSGNGYSDSTGESMVNPNFIYGQYTPGRKKPGPTSVYWNIDSLTKRCFTVKMTLTVYEENSCARFYFEHIPTKFMVIGTVYNPNVNFDCWCLEGYGRCQSSKKHVSMSIVFRDYPMKSFHDVSCRSTFKFPQCVVNLDDTESDEESSALRAQQQTSIVRAPRKKRRSKKALLPISIQHAQALLPSPVQHGQALAYTQFDALRAQQQNSIVKAPRRKRRSKKVLLPSPVQGCEAQADRADPEEPAMAYGVYAWDPFPDVPDA